MPTDVPTRTTVTSALHLPSTPLRACVSFISHAFKSPPLYELQPTRAFTKGRPFYFPPLPMSNLLIISPNVRSKVSF